MKYWNTEFYIQDNWRVNRRLTLDVGLRFYNQPPQNDVNGTFANFFPVLRRGRRKRHARTRTLPGFKSQLQLVFLTQGPRFDAPLAQIAREFRGESVQCQDALRIYQFDITHEVVVIRVIGERKRGVDLITIDRARLHRPAADHRYLFLADLLQHLGTDHVRRADQDFAGDIVRVVALVFTKRLAELLVDLRHPVNGAVQHRLESCAREGTENFLRLA